MSTPTPSSRRSPPAPAKPMALGRHLLGLRGLSPDAMRGLLRRAHAYLPLVDRDAPASDRASVSQTLRGKVVATLFLEHSTRTRVSFEIAARRLGAEVVHAGGADSSAAKGETIVDTARTINAMGVDAIVVRAAPSGASSMIAQDLGPAGAAIINAGEGRREHPTQGLLDALALAEALGKADTFDLSGVHVAIVGDIANSRVARSDVYAFRELGADVTLVGPPALAPKTLESLAPGVRVAHGLDAVLAERPTAIQALRVQFERSAAIASARAYRDRFGLTVDRATSLPDGTLIMHPGPANPGLEIDHAVLAGEPDHLSCLVRRQVAAGVAVRMGVLESLTTSSRESAP